MLVGYARVSTHDQDTGLQIAALRQAGCERIFEEHASGAHTERPQLNAALDFAREGDTLTVWKLDRLGRNLPHLIETVEELSKRGVGFRSLTETIDTTSAGGRLIFSIFGALAEFERALIKERTLAGLARARALGRRPGRRPALNPADITAARAMLRDEKITVREVAKRLGVSVPALYRHIKGGRSSIGQENRH